MAPQLSRTPLGDINDIRRVRANRSQSRAARIAVGPSTVRGRGNKGTVAAARAHLRDLDLRPFGTSSPKEFATTLNDATVCLQRALPPSARHWGVARKVLNIFLRDCLYTTYLRHFALSKAESFLELPLDSVTADQLLQFSLPHDIVTTVPEKKNVAHDSAISPNSAPPVL